MITSFRTIAVQTCAATLLWMPSAGRGASLEPDDLAHAEVVCWHVADGLPEESITAITESEDGYIWISTRNGLVRFDGRTFVTYAPGEVSRFHDQGVNGVAADQHVLWAGGRDFIGFTRADRFNSFTNVTFQTTRFPRQPGDRYGLMNFSRSRNGDWLLWRTDSIYSLPRLPEGAEVTPAMVSPAPAGEELLGFHEGPSGRRWIVTRSGVKIWNGGAWRPVRPFPNTTSTIVEASDGTLWIYSTSGLHRIASTGLRHYGFERPLTGSPAKALIEDRSGAIWVGAEGYITRITGDRVERLPMTRSFPADDLVQAIYQSRDGAIWMGTRTGVLVRMHKPAFTAVGPQQGVQGTSIAAVQQDAAGRIWIGSRGAGVFVQDGKQWRTVAGTERRVLQAMRSLKDGRVLGADSEGLWLSAGNGIKRILHRPDTVYASFRAISDEYDDYIYFSDGTGIYRLRLRDTSSPTKISDVDAVRAILEAEDGVWAVSWDRGLLHVSNGRTTEYPIDVRKKRRVFSLTALTPEIFLIGTSEGVFGFDRKARKLLAGRVFLNREEIFFIQPDQEGNLWFAGRKGLFSAERRAVLEWFVDQRSALTPIQFTARQGLVSGNFGLGTSSVATLDRDGRVWLASQGGAFHFRSAALISARADIRCAIESIRADGVPVSLNGPVQLKAGTARVEIQYTVLGRKAGESPAFRYRLASDGPWVRSRDFVAAYTNLGPGRHTFQLQGRVASLQWPDSILSIDFEVEPFWHQRWQTRLFALVVVVFGVVAFLRIRGARARRQTEELEERVRLRTAELAEARDQAERLRSRAEAAAQAKSDFLANMSHEIRTPLNGIIGTTELVLESELATSQRELLKVARVSADALLTVIDDVLDFSRIDAGKITLAPVQFSIRQVVADTLRIVTPNAKRKQLELSASVAPQVPDLLIADVGRLRQVLLNLLANAIKFTENGSVQVSVDIHSLTEHGPVVRFTVRDTGIGIPPSMHTRIFQAFEQADGSITRRYGGTGLGLAISARLVGLMNGRVWLDSKQGEGSTFYFTVSARVAEYSDPNTDSEGIRALAEVVDQMPARILLAEDNEVNELVAVRLLESKGHQVTVARNGLEALAAWETERFDLILLDVQMPELDGIETAREIRRRERPDRHISIVALTAGAFSEDRARCLAAGMDDFVTKPIVPTQLFGVVDRWLRQPANEGDLTRGR